MNYYNYQEEFNTLIEHQETIITNQETLQETLNTSLTYIVVIAVLIASNMIHHLFDAVYKKK